uniref:Uncharacterized protein n=1 Tax=Arundo donax TaxID=35708 RepID=A0A0A9ET81_ARUDO
MTNFTGPSVLASGSSFLQGLGRFSTMRTEIYQRMQIYLYSAA